MTEVVLDMERINFLLSTTKQRGIYEVDIQAAADSGELATNFSELPYYKGKDVQAVRNSINGNIEKKSKENEWPTFQVVIDKSVEGEDGERVDTKDKSKWSVILVNMDVLAAKVAEQNDDEQQ